MVPGGVEMVGLLKNPFVGVHELRKNLTELLTSIREEDQDLVVTQNGKPVAVLMDVEKYLEMHEAIREFSDPEYLAALLQAKAEIEAGKGVPLEEVLPKTAV